MWLLDTHTIALEYINKPGDTKYAILSHTWEDEEVTFQELLAGTGTHKKGYLKIVKTCQQARADGLDRVWVDTCCINKESSAELTESINSMWSWYREAEVCYAFLSDVQEEVVQLSDSSHPDFGHEDARTDRMGHLEFAESRWFTRGWTLQELIAPRQLVFFNASWRQIGLKDSLVQTLWSITGIDPFALRSPDNLKYFVIARKMSWAAQRKTTRLEDRAYSLLGIFGVNMPLLYGEGDKAFIRLQEEIIKTSTDHSVFAWDFTNAQTEFSGDLLFATSPDNFANCKRATHWSTGVFDEEYRLTNRGIKFGCLLVYETSDENYFAVLNCRFEDDLASAGLLCLNLCNEDEYTPAEEADLDRLRGDDEFWVRGPPSSRLVLFDDTKGEDIGMPDRRVTLLRHHPVLGRTSQSSTLRDGKLAAPRIYVVSTGGDIDLLEGYPPALWNVSKANLCLVFGVHVRKASVVVQGKVSKISFSLAFEPSKLTTSGRSLVISSRSQGEAREITSTRLDQEAFVDPRGPVHPQVSARLRPATVMDEEFMHVIEIHIGERPPWKTAGQHSRTL